MTELFSFTEVRPVTPPAAYIGGKKQLAARIASLIEQIPHGIYAEPFVGMGGVFFRRRQVPRSEVINDRSGDVTTLFRENAKALKIRAISEIERLEGELRYWRDRMAMSEHFIDQWNVADYTPHTASQSVGF